MSFNSPDNYVYGMSCGHELDSPIRRTEGVTVNCSMHGPVRLVSGDFLVPGASQEHAARETLARIQMALNGPASATRKLDMITNLIKPF
jgi:hypothetical protein